MKVLEYGHLQPETVKCNGCGALLEYTKADVTIRYPYENIGIIRCPVCKKIINVSS